MKRVFAIGGCAVLAFVIMSTWQVVKSPAGLTVAKGGQAFAADLRPPPPPPPAPPPVGKGKAPVGKGKAPIVTRG